MSAAPLRPWLLRSAAPCLRVTLLVGVLWQSSEAGALQWRVTKPGGLAPAPSATSKLVPIGPPQSGWNVVTMDATPSSAGGLEAQPGADVALLPKPTPWVTGGLYQIRRGNEVLPAITQRVPSGYGSRFLGAQAGLFLENCNVTGSNVCGTTNFIDQFNDFAKGAVDFNLGLGDPTRWLGVDLGFNFTSLTSRRPGQDVAITKFGEGQGINLALSRNPGPNVGFKVGAINLIELDETQKDTGRSAYAVVSGRIDLGGPPDKNTNDLYITAGLANGLFRPLDTIVRDQGEACDALLRRKGTNVLTPQQRRNCNADGLNYGSPSPVAAVAWVINPQVSLLAEWWGRNLTLAASFKPIRNVNWVITPGVTNLIRNSDWDPDVPGYTEQVRLQVTTSLGF